VGVGGIGVTVAVGVGGIGVTVAVGVGGIDVTVGGIGVTVGGIDCSGYLSSLLKNSVTAAMIPEIIKRGKNQNRFLVKLLDFFLILLGFCENLF